jgi:hypothetical protein
LGWVRPNYMGWAHLGWAEVSPTSFALRGLGRHSSGLETMGSPLYTCYVNSGDGGWRRRRRRRGGSWPDCGSRRRSSLLELELLVLLQNEVVVHWGELFSMVACSRGCWGKGNLILFFSFCFFFLYFSFFCFSFVCVSLSLVCFFLVLVSVFVPRVARERRRGDRPPTKINVMGGDKSGQCGETRNSLSLSSKKMVWESPPSILVTRNPNWSQRSGTGTSCVKGRY